MRAHCIIPCTNPYDLSIAQFIYIHILNYIRMRMRIIPLGKVLIRLHFVNASVVVSRMLLR